MDSQKSLKIEAMSALYEVITKKVQELLHEKKRKYKRVAVAMPFGGMREWDGNPEVQLHQMSERSEKERHENVLREHRQDQVDHAQKMSYLVQMNQDRDSIRTTQTPIMHDTT